MSLHGTVSEDLSTVVEQGVYPPYRGFRFEEEFALETKLKGLTVPNAQGHPIPVGVLYQLPARELDKVLYPYFLLEFLDMTPRRNEEHRGWVPYYSEANTGNPPTAKNPYGYFPVPCMLNFQCSVYSRVQQHDVILNDLLATTFFPLRFGQLNCASGTVRRLDWESGPINRDFINPKEQRTYCKVWTISVSAEFVPPLAGTEQVTEVNVTVGGMVGDVDLTITSTD